MNSPLGFFARSEKLRRTPPKPSPKALGEGASRSPSARCESSTGLEIGSAQESRFSPGSTNKRLRESLDETLTEIASGSKQGTPQSSSPLATTDVKSPVHKLSRLPCVTPESPLASDACAGKECLLPKNVNVLPQSSKSDSGRKAVSVVEHLPPSPVSCGARDVCCQTDIAGTNVTLIMVPTTPILSQTPSQVPACFAAPAQMSLHSLLPQQQQFPYFVLPSQLPAAACLPSPLGGFAFLGNVAT